MAKLVNVKPGDLIKADLINGLIAYVQDLETRLVKLESSGTTSAPVKISGITGSVRVGEVIEVNGANFSAAPSKNKIKIGTTTVENTISESETLLKFIIPPVVGAPTTVTLRVTNASGSTDSLDFYVLAPVVKPTGRFVPTENAAANTALGTILAGSTYTFKFNVASQTNVAESYRFKATFSNATGATAAQWALAAKIVDAGDNVLSLPPTSGATFIQSSQTKSIDPTEPVAIGVRITIPAGATRADLTLTGESLNNSNPLELQISTVTIPIVIGAAQKVSDPRVIITRSAFGPDNVSRAVVEAGRDIVEVPYGGTDLIGFSLQFQNAGSKLVAGKYHYAATLEPAAAGVWKLDTSTLIDSTEQQGSGELIGVLITLLAAQAAGHPEERTLVITATRLNTAGDAVESFLRIPVRGYVHS